MTIHSIAEKKEMQELLPLTEQEQSRRIELEQIIERGFQTFIEVGTALLEIRDSRLYRQEYRTFEEYCRGRWGFERRQAYRLIDAAAVVANVSIWTHKENDDVPHGTQILPTTERQARPLTKLEPEVQREVWREVTESTEPGKITAKVVEAKSKDAEELNEAVREVKARGNDNLPLEGEIIARGEKEIIDAAKAIRAKRTEERKQQNEALKEAAKGIEVPANKYKTIIIDPPWNLKKIVRDIRPNQVSELDYPVMSLEEIKELPVPDWAHDESHLYLWTTQKYLPKSFSLLEAWGFSYVFTMVWHKPGGFQPTGLAQYNCEFVVFGRKGGLSFEDTKEFFTCFNAPRREHSRKPDEFYYLVKRVSPGPRIEIFSREARDGFDQYGNEPGKFSKETIHA